MYTNCLLFAIRMKLTNLKSARILMQPALDRFPSPPHFVCVLGDLVYDFLADEDISDLRCWFPYKGHVRVRNLYAYKIYHPERTDL